MGPGEILSPKMSSKQSPEQMFSAPKYPKDPNRYSYENNDD